MTNLAQRRLRLGPKWACNEGLDGAALSSLDDRYLGLIRRRDPETLRSIVHEHGRRLYGGPGAWASQRARPRISSKTSL